MKLVHISDTHFVASGMRILNLDPEARLREVIASVNLNHADADLCVFSGDLSDRGDVESYLALRHVLQDLSVPYRLMLGNHDNRQHFLQVFPEHVHCADGFAQTYHRGTDVDLLLLDSLDDAHPAIGRLCPARLAWVRRVLDAAAGRPMLAFVHHPPFDIGMPWFEAMLLQNGDEVMELLLSHGHVTHLAFGHVHLDTSGVHRGVSFSATRGTAHKIAFSQAPHEAFYSDAGPSYDVMLATAQGVVVHHETPRDRQAVIGRERATPDGKGIFEAFEQQRVYSQAGSL